MMTKRFTLTKDHIKLLRKMCVGWQDCEAGAPEIDPKRPYGNSDVYDDIHEILTGKSFDDDDRKEENRYIDLHRETETALQVVLSTGKFKAGTYECDEYGEDWKLVKS